MPPAGGVVGKTPSRGTEVHRVVVPGRGHQRVHSKGARLQTKKDLRKHVLLIDTGAGRENRSKAFAPDTPF